MPVNVKIVPTEYSPPNCVILHDLNNSRALLLILSKSMRSRGIEPEKWHEISGKKFGISKEIIKYFQIKSLVITEEWWGLRFPGEPYYRTHRENGPAHVRYSNNKIIEEEWYLNDRLYRKDDPARIEYSSGIKIRKEWYVNGVLHREEHPAVISYFSSGVKYREVWYLQGVRHRENGPAFIEYDITGRKVREEWYKNGMLHRTDGPARIVYINTPAGTSAEFPEYFIEDKWVSEEEFKKYAKIYKLLNETPQKKKIKL